MLREIKAAPILEETRGHEGFDMEFLAERLMRLSQSITDIAQINEIDINPLKVFKHRGMAVDARIVLCRRNQTDS